MSEKNNTQDLMNVMVTVQKDVSKLIGAVEANTEANKRDHIRYETTHEAIFNRLNSLEISRGKLVILLAISGITGSSGGWLLQHIFR